MSGFWKIKMYDMPFQHRQVIPVPMSTNHTKQSKNNVIRAQFCYQIMPSTNLLYIPNKKIHHEYYEPTKREEIRTVTTIGNKY